jgi:hypothetical protein
MIVKSTIFGMLLLVARQKFIEVPSSGFKNRSSKATDRENNYCCFLASLFDPEDGTSTFL